MLITINTLMNEENIVTIDKTKERYNETWDIELAEHLSLNTSKFAIVTSDNIDNPSHFNKLYTYITDQTNKTALHKFITKDGCVMYYQILDVCGYPIISVPNEGGLIVYYMPLNAKVVL